MKQQCHISYVYSSWLILACGLVYYILRGNYVQAVMWIVFIIFFMWLYVKLFPSLSRLMGYGSVEDEPATDIQRSSRKVILYTGVGCPFCPLVKKRLADLQTKMGFDLQEIDITFKPEMLMSKGIRALPVVEVGTSQWIGNATSEQLAKFIEHPDILIGKTVISSV